MTQFLAILRDSFREAVDGFVIYVMLGLTAVLLLLVASLSFTPVPAEEVVPALVGVPASGPQPSDTPRLPRGPGFAIYIPDQGRAKPVALGFGVNYATSDIKTDGGTVSFRLTAKAPASDEGDAFRRAVAGWLKAPGATEKVQFGSRDRRSNEKKQAPPDGPGELGLEFVPDQGVTAAEAAAVTDEQMAAFVANQTDTHFGVRGSTATRVTGAGEGAYAFDVRAPGATSGRAWPQETALFFGGWKFGRFPLGASLHVVQDTVINGLGAGVALIIGVVITAFFIPNMLRKGALDLLIAKPIGRTPLLVYKYIGGLTFVFLLSVAAIGGAWVVLGLRSGHWDARFLLVIPLLTFTFAVLYAISTLTAVMTRSAIAAILITLTFGFVLYLIGQFKTIADLKRNAGLPIMGNWPEWMFTLADTLNDALPRYKDLDKLTTKVIDEGSLPPVELRAKAGQVSYPSWGGAVGLSLAWIAALLAIACWRFKRRDS